MQSDDQALRSKIIRLASTHPEFRKDLLPLLRGASSKTAEPYATRLLKEVTELENMVGNMAEWAARADSRLLAMVDLARNQLEVVANLARDPGMTYRRATSIPREP